MMASMPFAAAGNEMPVRLHTSFKVRMGRARRASKIRNDQLRLPST